jgi:hypothetical protein
VILLEGLEVNWLVANDNRLSRPIACQSRNRKLGPYRGGQSNARYYLLRHVKRLLRWAQGSSRLAQDCMAIIPGFLFMVQIKAVAAQV